eukprot:TRINITY_DN170_c0_g1_i1.p1 TRINITY_DN170_c0_g1~~TRINITY_DN170_c0_g1_i1.p1  ORF type:complete len:234 (-),score=8.55 TRINITY_DN170_c0_g1_i1:76-777(-)
MVERFDLPRDLDVKAGSIVPSLDKMYFPAHARFGAFVVGAILALRLRKCNKKRGNFDFILSGILYIVFLGMSLSVILVPMLPIPPEVPKEAQFFSGVFLRHAYSLSVSFLLFSATCPPKHPFYSPLLRTALSFKFMYPLSKLTFVIYLTHVRVQLQIFEIFHCYATRVDSLDSSQCLRDIAVYLCVYIVVCVPVCGRANVCMETKAYQEFVPKKVDEKNCSLIHVIFVKSFFS